jgi:hypothetical protein
MVFSHESIRHYHIDKRLIGLFIFFMNSKITTLLLKSKFLKLVSMGVFVFSIFYA